MAVQYAHKSAATMGSGRLQGHGEQTGAATLLRGRDHGVAPSLRGTSQKEDQHTGQDAPPPGSCRLGRGACASRMRSG